MSVVEFYVNPISSNFKLRWNKEMQFRSAQKPLRKKVIAYIYSNSF